MTNPTPDIEVTSTTYSYLGDGKVQVSLKTMTGEVIAYTMAGDVFLKTIRSVDAFWKAHEWDIVAALRLV
jgi:hypothetical protein